MVSTCWVILQIQDHRQWTLSALRINSFIASRLNKMDPITPMQRKSTCVRNMKKNLRILHETSPFSYHWKTPPMIVIGVRFILSQSETLLSIMYCWLNQETPLFRYFILTAPEFGLNIFWPGAAANQDKHARCLFVEFSFPICLCQLIHEKRERMIPWMREISLLPLLMSQTARTLQHTNTRECKLHNIVGLQAKWQGTRERKLPQHLIEDPFLVV